MKWVSIFLLTLALATHQSHSSANFSTEDENSTCSSSSELIFPLESACSFSFFPCSFTIVGNLLLCAFYAIILGVAAKFISDGAEMLLDLGLPAGIIGGVVLPLLGAVPDSVMIIFSGIDSNRTIANSEISVGMGTLAGSTIMLLTLPWVGSLILGRVDIVDGVGEDGTTSSCTIKSFINQGITVYPDVTYSAVIMIITTIPYFIVQGAGWHYGPTRSTNYTEYPVSGQPSYIRYSALATSILALIFLVAYLIFQIIYSVNSKRKEDARKEIIRQQMVQRNVIKKLLMTGVTESVNKIKSSTDEEEKKALIESGTRKLAKVWRTHRAAKQNQPQPEDKPQPQPEKAAEASAKETSDEEESEPKWKICLKCITYLIGGVLVVTIFSDPMVGALTALADSSYRHFTFPPCSTKGQYLPIPVFYLSFIVTPLCSNASEVVTSLIFASKRTTLTSSMTYSQLYGAVTMNNTLCLAVFTALVFFNDLEWQFSAEVTVIIAIEVCVGTIAIIFGFALANTYRLIAGLFVGILYFFSIFLIAALEKFAHWK